MLNPSLSNFEIQLTDDFFPRDISEKYDNYLFHMNYPFKSIRSCIMESLQTLTVPGLSINPMVIQAMDNTGRNPRLDSNYFPHTTNNRAYEGNEPWWNLIENTNITLSFRNNIINWMYFYEIMHERYNRRDRVNQFGVVLIMKDSAEIPVIRFSLNDCFITNIPGLEFAFNQNFNETKTVDIQITFNKLDVEMCIPDFNAKKYDTRVY